MTPISLDRILQKAAYFEQQKAALTLEMDELKVLLAKVETTIFQYKLKWTKAWFNEMNLE